MLGPILQQRKTYAFRMLRNFRFFKHRVAAVNLLHVLMRQLKVVLVFRSNKPGQEVEQELR